MKRLTKSVLAMALLTSSIGLVAAAAAMPFGDGPGCERGGYQAGAAGEFRGMGPNLDRLADRLNMTDEQRAEVEAIQREARQQMVVLKDRMKANRSQIRDLVGSEDYDENAVRRVAGEQGDLRAEVIMLRARMRQDMKRVLNDDQLAQLDSLRPRKQGRGRGF
jgi:Spy/CpxP family protein refolding chaperone